jgi:hypothetical protein
MVERLAREEAEPPSIVTLLLAAPFARHRLPHAPDSPAFFIARNFDRTGRLACFASA